jgi:hypothetical protein
MQLRKLTRFLKASALLMLAALMVVTLAPVSRAQEQINVNALLVDFPGGLGNVITGGTNVPGLTVLFPRGNAGANNGVSDVITDDFNGDGFTDILAGSFTSDEVALLLGRGNGSFVRARLGTLVGDAQGTSGAGVLNVNYSDAANFAGDGTAASNAAATSGIVTSMATVAPFGFFGAFSRVAVAIDYDGTSAVPFDDQILYLDINFNGNTAGNVGFSVNGQTDFAGNPVAVTVGNVTGGLIPDVAYLCSGSFNTGVDDGFAGIDIAADAGVGSPEQVIGGGLGAGNAVVNENGFSGSLYDAQGTVGSINDYDDEAGTIENNRRQFKVAPITAFQGNLCPRAIMFSRTSQLQDGANDLVFVANDNGSVGDGVAGIDSDGDAVDDVLSAPDRTADPVGSVFVLLNDTTSASFQGTILRNARRQDEDYDFGSTPPFPFGKQNGLILPSGNLPSGLSGGDFNGDNVFDICSSNNLSGTVTIFNSGDIAAVQPTAAPTSPLVSSYPNVETTFLPVGGSPTTVYTQDLNGDGKLDILGTNLLPGGYALFGSSTSGGTLFNQGTLRGLGLDSVTTSNGAVSLAINTIPASGVIPINGLRDPIEFGDNAGTLLDIVIARGSTGSDLTGFPGGLNVGYGTGSGANFVQFGTVRLSSFVGVAEGNINNDALPDVAIVDRGAFQVVTILNSADGLATTARRRVGLFNLLDFFPRNEAGGLTSLDIGDVNRDNLRDIVVAVDGPNDQAVVLYNLGSTQIDFDTRFTIRAFPMGGDPTAIKLADLAGPAGPGSGTATGKDGAPEMIAVNRRTNSVTTLINNGAGIFGQGRVAETGGFDPLSQALADYNDDGKLDTAVLNRGRRGLGNGTGEEDDSVVSIMLGNGDGSFQATNFLVPVPRQSVSIAATGYGVVRNAIQIDTPDLNLDGITDLAVASQLGGDLTNDIDNPFTVNDTDGTDEAGALTVLFGSSSQDGQFTRSTQSQSLVDTVRTGGRVATFPGSPDPLGLYPVIGYGELAINADFNQNGRPDAYVGGVETNNGNINTPFAANDGVLENLFAGTMTSLDNLSSAFAAQRTTNVFPSASNNLGQAFGVAPVDEDTVTGVASAGAFVVSDTGAIVDQFTNDFDLGNFQICPDAVSVTRIGRVYESINITSILNHAPIVTTSNGNRAFDGPGRKVVLSEAEQKTINVKAEDVDQSLDGRLLKYRLVEFPSFVSLTDNGNGTASISVKPGLTDGSATANNGLGQDYRVAVEVTDQDFRLPLTSLLFFRVFVKDAPTAPSITPIPDQVVNATLSLAVPVTATDATNRRLTMSTTFAQPFSTFTDGGGGTALFQFRPTEANGGVFNVNVTATNDLGLSATASFKLTVIVNTAPTLSAIADVTLAEGVSQAVSVRAIDPDLGTLNQTLTLSVSGNPSFAILSDAGNGNGSISLSPKIGDAGTYRITVRALDNGIPAKTGEVSFNVTVTSTVQITAASYAKKRLFVAGSNFGPNPTLIVNGVTVPANLIVPTSAPNSITAKGNNKKQLGLRKGTNTLEVIGINGVKSAAYTLNLADAE